MESGYAQSMARLMEQLRELPGVGRKTAERLAHHIVRLPEGQAAELASSIREVKETVRQCSNCYRLAESDPCPVCADPQRDRSRICVVETPKDAVKVEESGCYNGLYHVLCGRVAPLDDENPEELTVEELRQRAASDEVEEIILATNPDTEGESTALYVKEALEDLPVTLTRLARGIPSGSNLEYANAAILGDALEGRKPM